MSEPRITQISGLTVTNGGADVTGDDSINVDSVVFDNKNRRITKTIL